MTDLQILAWPGSKISELTIVGSPPDIRPEGSANETDGYDPG